MDFHELLPIGTVVLLRGGKKRLMIVGIGQHDPEEDRDYDYLGTVYPEGYMGEGSMFLFDRNDVVSVSFRGCDDEEREAFISGLQERYDAAAADRDNG